MQALGAEVYGISVDDEATQRAFAEQMKTQFPLVADADRQVSRAFGVLWPLVKINRRITVVLDRERIVRGVFHHELQIARHPEEVVELLRELERERPTVPG
jgi:peroxiredoxin Q/BCP